MYEEVQSGSGVNPNEPINYHYTALSTLLWSSVVLATNFKIFEPDLVTPGTSDVQLIKKHKTQLVLLIRVHFNSSPNF